MNLSRRNLSEHGLWAGLLSLLFLVLVHGVQFAHAQPEPHAQSGAPSPELAYLKQVNRWRPPTDPQLHFLLMGQFANAGRHLEGIAFFEDALKRHGPRLSDNQKAQYLLAIASLRAGHANDVFLLKRIGWVRDTVTLLDDAKRLSTGRQMFVSRWMSGVVRAQLPAFLSQGDTALADLSWCADHAALAPHRDWLREVHAKLADVHRARGDGAQAARHLALSGYTTESRPAIFTTPFGIHASAGGTFAPQAIREVVRDSVYVLSGFEFTEYHFVISADRCELIAIDAGTRPDSARAAHEALKAAVPSLPPLTTVLVTHAHWDHVGGHSYFRGLNPAVRFIGRSNYQDELAIDAMADPAGLRRFFGERFRLEDVLSYKPDVTVDRATPLVIGGTRFSLLPTRGGETDDALLVHMPDSGVLFVGDILMPYFGAPFQPEGSVDGLLAAIDQVHALKPNVMLHGHEPLTRNFSSTAMLIDLRPQLQWLRDEVGAAMRRGTPRAAIQQANLMPPTLEASTSEVHLTYLLLRENLINRVFQQHSGYWQNGLHGLDALTDADHGAALVDYLGLSDAQIAKAAQRMIKDGRHELAASMLQWAQARHPDSPTLAAPRAHAYAKLMEKYQEFNPFKLFIYGAQAGQAVPQVAAEPPVPN
ncbi:MAG TPA: MBL fold metallo-hydrolase [Burkholderiaceae bacterium]|nr:MBL fold metallo-hydrolase [Burkholderiaceae bacterium]